MREKERRTRISSGNASHKRLSAAASSRGRGMFAAADACKSCDPLCAPIEKALFCGLVELEEGGRPMLLIIGAFLGGVQFSDLVYEQGAEEAGNYIELVLDLLTGCFFSLVRMTTEEQQLSRASLCSAASPFLHWLLTRRRALAGLVERLPQQQAVLVRFPSLALHTVRAPR